ncbi:PorV/PorQ family protein [Candidatus Fermentibacteria bacterium]|nr:PorV/PorQ family protein [Candidatus Fermentibacteria bacterium]
MKRFGLLLLIAAFAWSPCHAQGVSKAGTTAATFLSVGQGSRAIAMGGAFVAVANDVSALYWNPAGAARLNATEFLFCHNEWLADMTFDYVASALPMGNGVIGLSATFLSMGSEPVRTVNEPDGTGEFFDAGSYAMSAGYSRMLTDRFSFGLMGKVVREYIKDCSSTGFALDVGTLFETQWRGLMVGMSISNFGTKMQMAGNDVLVQVDIDPTQEGNNENINAHLALDRFDMPLVFRVGLAMDLLRDVPNNSLLISVDALHPNDNTEAVDLGLEYGLANRFFARVGYKSLFMREAEEGLTAGAGFSLPVLGAATLGVDYAYQAFGRLEQAHRLSVSLRTS